MSIMFLCLYKHVPIDTATIHTCLPTYIHTYARTYAYGHTTSERDRERERESDVASEGGNAVTKQLPMFSGL